MAEPQSERELHNLRQQVYFGMSIKPTMVPRRTRYLQRHMKEAVRAAGVMPGDQVLEVGCGMGRYTLLLADAGYQVTGIDISQYLLDRLSEYNAGRTALRLACVDVADAPHSWDASFDAVLAFFTLHHVHDIEACISAMTRLVRPGGRVVLLEPNPFNPLYYLQITFTPGMRWGSERGLLRMRKPLVTDAMGATGLSAVEVHRFGFFPPQLANRRWATSVERRLESFPLWRRNLPFQLFSGTRSF